jgi:hypothetical protein
LGFKVCDGDVNNVLLRENLELFFRGTEHKSYVLFSVADPDPRSGAFLTPGLGSGIRGFFRITDPKPIFLRA